MIIGREVNFQIVPVPLSYIIDTYMYHVHVTALRQPETSWLVCLGSRVTNRRGRTTSSLPVNTYGSHRTTKPVHRAIDRGLRISSFFPSLSQYRGRWSVTAATPTTPAAL